MLPNGIASAVVLKNKELARKKSCREVEHCLSEETELEKPLEKGLEDGALVVEKE